jgi:methylated-DNA-[protein]-cysteine S-methyltransferase
MAGPAFASTSIETPLGRLTVVSSGRGIVATAFDEGDDEAERGLDALERTLDAVVAVARGRTAERIRREVDGYFVGRRGALRSPVDLRLVAPGFARRVLEVTRAIPYGELNTYGDVAAAAGSPRGGRAAGSALARCPIELWIPCHRVVHADGHIGGYGRHEDRKRFLLRHEGAIDPRPAPRDPRRPQDAPTGPARD